MRVLDVRVEAFLIAVVTIPILGTFFPLESYLSAPTMANPLGTPVETTRATSIILTLLAAAVVGLLAWDREHGARALARNWPVLLLVGWMFVTASWSESPFVSINRTGRALIVSLYAIYLAESFDERRLMRILFVSLIIGMIACVLITVAVPSLSRSVDARGVWRGAYVGKNATGAVAALGLLFGLYCWVGAQIKRGPAFLLVVLSATFVVLSNSVTALLAVLVAIAVALWFRIFTTGQRESRLFAVTLSVLGAGLLVVLIMSASEELAIAGRDATFTGRTDIWRFAERMSSESPFWGYGHGAWGFPNFSAKVRYFLGWPSPHAHQTWLDYRLQLGLPGLVFGVTVWLMAAKRGLAAAVHAPGTEYLVWIAVLIFAFLRSFSETVGVEPGTVDLFWIVLASARLRMLLPTGVATDAVRSESRVLRRVARQAARSS